MVTYKKIYIINTNFMAGTQNPLIYIVWSKTKGRILVRKRSFLDT